jgi:hypothetical protein
MADRISPEERRLIDEHLITHGAQVIPRGVSGDDLDESLRDRIAGGFRVRAARNQAICAEAAHSTVGELAKRHGLGLSMIRMILNEGDAWAKGQDRRPQCRL